MLNSLVYFCRLLHKKEILLPLPIFIVFFHFSDFCTDKIHALYVIGLLQIVAIFIVF